MNEFKNRFIELLKQKKPQILKKDLIADIETPISSLIKISKDQDYSFLLESVEGGDQRGRFSLLGCDPDIIWEVKSNQVNIKLFNKKIDLSFLPKDPILSLKKLINFCKIERDLNAPPFPVLVGYFGYPMIQLMEKIELKQITVSQNTQEIPIALINSIFKTDIKKNIQFINDDRIFIARVDDIIIPNETNISNIISLENDLRASFGEELRKKKKIKINEALISALIERY